MNVLRLRHRSDEPEPNRNSEAIYADSEGALKHLDSEGSVTDLGGSGGGSQPYLVAVAQLTNAQILALHATDIEVLDAPGIGKAYFVESVDCVLDASGGAYVNPSAAELDMGFAAYWAELAGSVNSPLDMTSATVQSASARIAAGGSNDYFSLALHGYLALGQIENTAFCVGNIGDAEWTGGHASNTFSIKVVYRIVDVAPFTS